MKKKLTFGKVIWFIIIAYLLIGLVFSLAGIAQRAIAGKGETFSPLVGIPLDMIGWPLNMKAAYMNGIYEIQFFATLAAMLIAFIWFIVMLFRKRNKE
jgi:hypothetical protein